MSMENLRANMRQNYVSPQIEVIYLKQVYSLMGTSPNAQPGGGKDGNIHIIPPDEDGDDDQITGAKGFKLWEDEEIE